MRFPLVVVAALAALSGGCASSSGPHSDKGGPAGSPAAVVDPKIAETAANVRKVVIRRGDGAGATWDEAVSAGVGADVVLIGELHGQPVGQAFESAYFEDVLARSATTTGALEFFERDQQAALDDYLAGLTDEAGMRKATRRSEGNYPSGHRAIIESSKAAGRPVIAANSPRVYVRLARTDGFDRLASLTPEQKRLFVIPPGAALPTGKYRDDFFTFMRGGATEPGDATSEAKIEGMFRSQSVWDATMADSVSRAMESGGKPVVLVVGVFHVGHEGGLVQALRRLKPGARVVTVTFVGAWAPESGVGDKERGLGDYVVFVGPSEE